MKIASMLKPFTCGALIGCICLGPVMSANAAASTHGAKKYATVNGVSFTMKNSMYTGTEGSDSHRYARAATSVQAEQNLDGGFMGVTPVLCNSLGATVKFGTTSYSSNDTSGTSSSVDKTYFADSAAYSSWGYVEIRNGSDYLQYRPARTASLNNYS